MGLNKQNYKILMITINNAWKHGNIGIDQLTGYLRNNGFSVDIMYFRTRDDINTIFSKINNNYDFYGFSVTSANIKMCIKLAILLKRKNQKTIIDFGGGFVTRYFKEIFKETDCVDFMTLGDGEIPTEILLKNLISNPDYLSDLNTGHYAIASKNDQDDKHQFMNTKIDYLPAFDYYETDTMVRNSRKVHCIQTKNNICTGNCTFCTERHGKVFYKDISQIIQEIKIVYYNYGVQKIFFTDDNIFDPNNNIGKENVKKLCLELLKLKENNYKLVYQCYIKAISLQDTPEDNEILALMKKVGFVEVFVGIESGNNSDLELYKKHTTVNDNRIIIKMLKRHGLFPIMGFIGFNPYSTLKKLEMNFRLLCDFECTYLPNYLYTFVNINKYTEIYDMAKRDGLISSPETIYCNIEYKYKDETVKPILNYVEQNMIPKLKDIQYETDWIIYSFMEHQILYEDLNDFSKELNIIKQKDFLVIKKYLSILFIEHDLEKFKSFENEFWNHFLEQQEHIKKVYRCLVNMHSIEKVIPFYAKKISAATEMFNSQICPDITVGYCKGKKIKTWFSIEERKKNKNDLVIKEQWAGKTIVVVLESPHKKEYAADYVSPALGKTGKNLQDKFSDIIREFIKDNEQYRIILMNSIQYQCSLGVSTTLYRDNIWLKLWYKEQLDNNFKDRIKEYSPDIVFNFCTQGNHKNEIGIPKGCKTVINNKYIEYCLGNIDSHYNKEHSLQNIVTVAIENTVKAKIYTASHPASWSIKKPKIKEIN